MPTPLLSKSRYMAGRQCARRLWLAVHHPERAEEPDAGQRARFETGDRFGALAQERFPGVLIDHPPQAAREAAEATAAHLASVPIPILHEATFLADRCQVRLDVLRPRPEGGFQLLEVKSSTQAKDVFIEDAAFQAWVARRAGADIRGVGLVLANPQYALGTQGLGLDGLFKIEDITPLVEDLQPAFEARVLPLQAVLTQAEAPAITPTSHCLDPYPCPFLASCTQDWPKPAHPTTCLPRLGAAKALDLGARGIHALEDLEAQGILKPQQRPIVEAHRTGLPWVSSQLQGALSRLQAPLHFLDFETFASIIPRLEGSRPMEAIPFQWSCHTLHEDGSLSHQEFLAEANGTDPRPDFIRTLIEALRTPGQILVYSPFENTQLKALQARFPTLQAEIQGLRDRMVDLLKIVREHLYHPGFRGSYSIKKVLPALVPGFGYEGMEIGNGLEAMEAFEVMLDQRPGNSLHLQDLKSHLLAYCLKDTLAMVRVLEALRQFQFMPPLNGHPVPRPLD